ncbi:MAG: hypothetical protein NT038_09720 [Euryarchaeota archaeon]|nr:hypothetical protein [Euryarchaeota archaeon]
MDADAVHFNNHLKKYAKEQVQDSASQRVLQGSDETENKIQGIKDTEEELKNNAQTVFKDLVIKNITAVK